MAIAIHGLASSFAGGEHDDDGDAGDENDGHDKEHDQDDVPNFQTRRVRLSVPLMNFDAGPAEFRGPRCGGLARRSGLSGAPGASGDGRRVGADGLIGAIVEARDEISRTILVVLIARVRQLRSDSPRPVPSTWRIADGIGELIGLVAHRLAHDVLAGLGLVVWTMTLESLLHALLRLVESQFAALSHFVEVAWMFFYHSESLLWALAHGSGAFFFLDLRRTILLGDGDALDLGLQLAFGVAF